MAKLSKAFRNATLQDVPIGQLHIKYIDGQPFWESKIGLTDSARAMKIPDRISTMVHTATKCHCGACYCCRMAKFVNRILSIDDRKCANGYLAGA